MIAPLGNCRYKSYRQAPLLRNEISHAMDRNYPTGVRTVPGMSYPRSDPGRALWCFWQFVFGRHDQKRQIRALHLRHVSCKRGCDWLSHAIRASNAGRELALPSPSSGWAS